MEEGNFGSSSPRSDEGMYQSDSDHYFGMSGETRGDHEPGTGGDVTPHSQPSDHWDDEANHQTSYRADDPGDSPVTQTEQINNKAENPEPDSFLVARKSTLLDEAAAIPLPPDPDEEGVNVLEQIEEAHTEETDNPPPRDSPTHDIPTHEQENPERGIEADVDRVLEQTTETVENQSEQHESESRSDEQMKGSETISSELSDKDPQTELSEQTQQNSGSPEPVEKVLSPERVHEEPVLDPEPGQREGIVEVQEDHIEETHEHVETPEQQKIEGAPSPEPEVERAHSPVPVEEENTERAQSPEQKIEREEGSVSVQEEKKEQIPAPEQNIEVSENIERIRSPEETLEGDSPQQESGEKVDPPVAVQEESVEKVQSPEGSAERGNSVQEETVESPLPEPEENVEQVHSPVSVQEETTERAASPQESHEISESPVSVQEERVERIDFPEENIEPPHSPVPGQQEITMSQEQNLERANSPTPNQEETSEMAHSEQKPDQEEIVHSPQPNIEKPHSPLPVHEETVHSPEQNMQTLPSPLPVHEETVHSPEQNMQTLPSPLVVQEETVENPSPEESNDFPIQNAGDSDQKPSEPDQVSEEPQPQPSPDTDRPVEDTPEPKTEARQQERATPSVLSILATPVQTTKPSSMMSLLVTGKETDEDTSKPPNAPRTVHAVTKTVTTNKPGVVIRKPNAIVDVLNHGATAPAPPAPTPGAPASGGVVTKKIHSRKINQNLLPDWQSNIATTFLMTPDMSCTDEDVDMSDPEFQGDGTPEMDQITEETTRCICNSPHESEVMIQCDSCKKWLHEDCVRLQNSREADPFICIFCQHEMAKAARAYVRRSLANCLGPILQRCQTDYQIPSWTEIEEVVKDTNDVLKMLPMFLPTADDAQTPET